MDTENIKIEILEFNSHLYDQAIDLRTLVLRKPLGLTYNAQDLQLEEAEIHIGALLENKVIGILLLREVLPNIFKMRQVAVHPKNRRMGIGRYMVEFCERYLKDKGAKEIELHARESALMFYKSLGYNIQGDLFGEIGIAHYKMIKSL